SALPPAHQDCPRRGLRAQPGAVAVVPPCHPWHHRSRWPDLVRWRSRARMQRRLFVWFGVSILVTAFVVVAVTSLVDRFRGPSGRAQWDNVQALIGAQASRVWDDP